MHINENLSEHFLKDLPRALGGHQLSTHIFAKDSPQGPVPATPLRGLKLLRGYRQQADPANYYRGVELQRCLPLGAEKPDTLGAFAIRRPILPRKMTLETRKLETNISSL